MVSSDIKRYAGVDIGLKRIGFCIAINRVTIPQPAILRKNRHQAAKLLDERLTHHQIDELVVGMPINDESSYKTHTVMQQRIYHFINLLDFLQNYIK